MEAIDLPQAAADPVADHRVAQLGPGGEAQAALPPAVFSGNRGPWWGATALFPLA